MALIPVEELSVLKPASEAKSVSQSALDSQQIMTVAHQINTAANTASTHVVYYGDLREATKKSLKDNGYKISQVPQQIGCAYKISWE